MQSIEDSFDSTCDSTNLLDTIKLLILASILNVQLRRRPNFPFSRCARESVNYRKIVRPFPGRVAHIRLRRRRRRRNRWNRRKSASEIQRRFLQTSTRVHAAACIRADAREDSHRLCARLTTTSTTTTATVVHAGAYK